MQIIMRPIGEIKKNPINPRIIKDAKFKQLVQSIKDFPQMLYIRPIVVNEDDIVLGGNMRLKACEEAGLKEIPILKASDLTEEQQREFIIKDNASFGEWDMGLMSKDWDEAQVKGWGLDLNWTKPEDMDEDFELPSGGKNEIETMTFKLHREQAALINEALGVSKAE